MDIVARRTDRRRQGTGDGSGARSRRPLSAWIAPDRRRSPALRTCRHGHSRSRRLVTRSVANAGAVGARWHARSRARRWSLSRRRSLPRPSSPCARGRARAQRLPGRWRSPARRAACSLVELERGVWSGRGIPAVELADMLVVELELELGGRSPGRRRSPARRARRHVRGRARRLVTRSAAIAGAPSSSACLWSSSRAGTGSAQTQLGAGARPATARQSCGNNLGPDPRVSTN